MTAAGSDAGARAAADALAHPERSEALPRTYWLKRRRLIRPLFDRRRDDVYTFSVKSIRLLARMASADEVGSDAPFQVGLAPGRRVRNAVERNRIRRLLRETFRRHQHDLRAYAEGHPETLTLMILFRGRPQEAPERIPHDLPRALEALVDYLR